jgi:hypothetical protein
MLSVNGGASNESEPWDCGDRSVRAALELGAHAPPAASIAVEKLQASLARPSRGSQMPMTPGRNAEGYEA